MNITEQFEIWHLNNYISRPLFASRNMKYEWENKKNEIARAYQAGYESQQAEITRLNEVVKMYEIDARRYRWLKCVSKEIVICRWNKSGCTEMFVDAIDKNIDQAMSEKGDK